MVEIDEEPIAEEEAGWLNLPEELPEEAVASLKQLARCDRHRCSVLGAASWRRRWRLRLRPRR